MEPRGIDNSPPLKRLKYINKLSIQALSLNNDDVMRSSPARKNSSRKINVTITDTRFRFRTNSVKDNLKRRHTNNEISYQNVQRIKI